MADSGTHDDPLDKMEGMQLDENVGDNTTNNAELQLSEKERQILELYDRLEEIKLEISFLQAQESIADDPLETISEKDLQNAQEALLEAKARYALRNTIVESVLMVNPVLKAVHAGLNATPIERDLRPLVQERDTLSVSLTERNAKVSTAMERLTKLEADHVAVARRNAELATTMLGLAEQADSQKKEDIQEPSVRAQLDELEESLKASRQRWRIMKGTASAVVVGSGIDWSRNASLRELVLDTEVD